MARRAIAVQATRDKFQGRPFKFGKNDCGQMVKFHLRAMGKPIKAAKAGTYHSLLGATRALKRLGYASLPALMDAHFGRIAPAAAVVGDIVAMPGVEGPGALTVAMGNGRVLGYHEDTVGAAVLQPLQMTTAWRVME